ncbi:hypothetical protein D3C86_2249900 [compost metagenome]
MLTFKMNPIRIRISLLTSLYDVLAKARDSKHASTVGDDLSVLIYRRTRVEHKRILHLI